jgi:hypothetical protein
MPALVAARSSLFTTGPPFWNITNWVIDSTAPPPPEPDNRFRYWNGGSHLRMHREAGTPAFFFLGSEAGV